VPSPRQYRPEIPEALEAIILKALARRPEDRFATAAELEQALRSLLQRTGQYVNRSQIASRMQQLVGADQVSSQADLQRLLLSQEPTQQYLPATEPDIPTTPAPEPDSRSWTRRWRRSSIAVLGGFAGLLVLLIAVAGFWMRSGRTPARSAAADRSAEPTPATRPPSDASADLAGGQVRLSLKVESPGVTPVVTFRGIDYAGAEFRMLIPRSRLQEVIMVHAPGYASERIELEPVRDYQNHLTLRALDTARRPPPMTSSRPLQRPPPRSRPTDLLRDLPRVRPKGS
jgi:hypothetical protein